MSILKDAATTLLVSYKGKSTSEKVFLCILSCAAYTLVTLGFVIVCGTIAALT